VTSRALSRLAVSFALAASFAACGGGGGGSSGSSAGASGVYLMVSDAPSDDLTSFEMTITGVFLQREGGGEGGNLLDAARRVNLLDLRTASKLLEFSSATPASYDGVRVVIDVGSILARDRAGAIVPVTATSTSALALVAPTLVLQGGRSAKLHLELPLDDALADDPNHAGALLYTPEAAMVARQSNDETLDELHGVVLAENQMGHSLLVRFFDRDTNAVQADLVVLIGAPTQLLAEDGDPFATEGAFFGVLHVGDAIQVRGVLSRTGAIEASLIHLEDDGTHDVARIRGTLSDLDPATDRAKLRLRTIDFGRTVVDPVLAGLGNPAEILIDYTNSEIRLGGDDPRSANRDDLAIGQTVQVDFAVFAGSPFPAREIEIEDERAEFEGTIVDDAAIPNAFVVHLEAHDPAVLNGLVASSTTDVDVLLDGFERIVLDLRGEPAVSASRLGDGLTLHLRGDLSGTPTTPQIAASGIEIDPGRLRGTVTAVDSASGTFTVDVDRVDASFGGPALPDPVVIRFETGAQVDGDALTATEFFQKFQGLGAGETMQVEVEGLADGANGAGAWLVDVSIENG
jgi:hypothetical protein